MTAIRRVSTDGRTMTVWFDDGSSAGFNRFWLRDNAPGNGDRASLFRPFSVATMSDDLTIVEADIVGDARDAVRVVFDDSTLDCFPVGFLRAHAAGAISSPAADAAPRSLPAQPTMLEFDAARSDDRVNHDLLDAVCRDGFAIVTGVPAHGTESVASWLGPIRETDFGRIFDIVTTPDPFTPSQSLEALDPHTDDPYRYQPAGVSVLHCIEQCAGTGGATAIVDGFAVADRIASQDPESFEILTTVRVPFVHRRERSVEQGAAVHLRASAPIISVDASGRAAGVRFHERSMATMPMEPDLAERFYRALMIFSRHVAGGEYTYNRRLVPGEAVVYDNQRVLHGRTTITGADSRRHLRLCTIDRDQVHSRFRQSCERHAPGTELQVLAAGAAV